jgi:hypothetical protein
VVEIVDDGLVLDAELEQVIVIRHLATARDATLDVPVGATRDMVYVKVRFVGFLHPLFKIYDLPRQMLFWASKLQFVVFLLKIKLCRAHLLFTCSP